jgi:nucleoid-associated protein YgaU
MGIFDKIKDAFDGDDEPEGIKGPSAVLREAGIDPSGLKFGFGGDGTVTITGHVADENRKQHIEEVVGKIPEVKAIDNQLQVGSPPAPEAQPEPTDVPELGAHPEGPPADPAVNAANAGAAVTPDGPVAEALGDAPATGTVPAASDSGTVAGGAEPLTYTVKSGDSLWKIAEAHYGDGSKYRAIFEANRDILDNPDLIHPGQELKIPTL